MTTRITIRLYQEDTAPSPLSWDTDRTLDETRATAIPGDTPVPPEDFGQATMAHWGLP